MLKTNKILKIKIFLKLCKPDNYNLVDSSY